MMILAGFLLAVVSVLMHQWVVHKRSEKRLRTALFLGQGVEEARTRLLLEEAPVLLFSFDGALRITSLRGGGTALLGVAPQALLGAPVAALFEGEECAAALQLVLLGERAQLELSSAHCDWKLTLEPLGHGSTQLGGVGFARDISAHRDAERAAKEARMDYAALFEETREPVFVARLDGRLLAANAATAELLGYPTREALLAAGGPAALRPNDPQGRAFVKQLLAVGELKNFPMQVRRCDGAQLEILVTCTLAPRNGARAAEMRGVIHDLTERNRQARLQAEHERAQLTATLAAAAAHDFNNFLTVISGNVQLARATPLRESADEIAPRLERIEAAVRDARATCERLGGIARPHALQRQPLSLNSFIERMAPQVRTLLGHGVRLECDLPTDCPLITADEAMLQQVLLNLATNARDAMQGCGTLRLWVRETAADTIEFGCADNGPGLPAAVLQRLFKAFVTTKAPGKGTGLGLWIIKRTMDLHDGSISVESTPDTGTRVILHFPAVFGAMAGSARRPRAASFNPEDSTAA